MKKVLKILTLIMLIFTIWKISDTYAKYFVKAQTSTLVQEVGKWVIKINNMDIYSEQGESVEFELNNFTSGSGGNTAPGKIAPGSEVYTDIVIDPTGTEVAVRYDIEVDLTAFSNLAVKARVEMASGENTLVQTGENTYTGTLTLSEVQAGDTADVRIYLTWENDKTKNEEDSETGSVADKTITVSANVTVSQYLGEEITEYVEVE